MELVKRDSDYAVRALVIIAREDRLMQTSEIAQTQGIPFDYLKKILRKLKAAGIVKVKRGTGGGFALAQPVENIKLLNIIESVQGPRAVNRCFLGKDRCSMQNACPVHDRLEPVQAGICELLAEITLAELIKDEPRYDKPGGRK
jgi:Rrf2 family protein